MTTTLNPGTTLRDRYVIESVIGRGGMGSIYQAEDGRLPGRLCAVKEVEYDADLAPRLREESREQFYREASVLARLDHPNLPKVSDYFSEAGRDYLVMDFVPGDDLKSMMDEARRAGHFLDPPLVVGWGIQLLDALEYMHHQEPPVIHRDIKPSNIKRMPSGLVKLVDFGLVKQMLPDEMTVTVIQGRGTALYTPLEQYGGDTGHTEPRSDLYSLGATLYHLLTNHPPPEAKERFLRPETLQPLRHWNPAIDPEVDRTVLWAMGLHPDDRPASAGTLKQALQEAPSATPTAVARPPSWGALLTELAPFDRALVIVLAVSLLLALLASYS
ncbi:MAG TPA: serine/threonine-protein kinase [Anaerolineales bacterium]|nr:serine/threonine-protein kinase [Anaerolineales bacterium]